MTNKRKLQNTIVQRRGKRVRAWYRDLVIRAALKNRFYDYTDGKHARIRIYCVYIVQIASREHRFLGRFPVGEF